jgi:riboflavin kinase/FMN adenylyltransferase
MGCNPTFLPEESRKAKPYSLEVHILNFNEDLYGQEIQVNFRKRIRDEVRFESPSHLIQQIQRDIQWAQKNVFLKTEPHS